MHQGQSFEVFIRKMQNTLQGEELYRVTIFRQMENMEELLNHTDVVRVVNNRPIRIQKIDNFRFELYVEIDRKPSTLS